MARILIIDDDRDARAALRRILEADGHEVEEAADGVQALRRFAGDPADAIFTDMFMPRMSGLDFMIRVRETFPESPIVAMSGGGQVVEGTDVLQAARALGAVRALVKPLTRASVREALEQVLGGR